MKGFLVVLFLLAALTGPVQSQWLDGGRTQPSPLMGNGALLVYDGVMYFYNEANHFQMSADNGATWTDPSDSIGGANPAVTRPMSGAGGRIYAALNFGTGNGVPIFSSDKGVTWQPDTLGAPGHALGWGGHPAVSSIYAWGHWVFVGWDAPNAYDIKTFDGPFKHNDTLAAGINNPSSMVSKGDTLFVASYRGVYYTIDGGEHWTVPKNTGLFGYGGKLFLDGDRMYLFGYKAFNMPVTLFYSDDNAENWTEIDVSSVMSRKSIGGTYYFPNTYFIKGQNIFFATTLDHYNSAPNLFQSSDLGKTWTSDTLGLPTKFVNGAVSYAYTNDGTLWVVPSYENIYKRKIDEGTNPGHPVTVAPLLIGPANTSTASLNVVDFVWHPAPYASKHELQISNQATFNALSFPALNSTDTVGQISAVGPDTYFWRVRGIGQDGSMGPWSEVWSFTVSGAGVEQTPSQAIRLSPNPAREFLSILSSLEIRDVEVLDILGRRVIANLVEAGGATVSGTTYLNTAMLSPGVYYLTLSLADGNFEVRRFMKR